MSASTLERLVGMRHYLAGALIVIVAASVAVSAHAALRAPTLPAKASPNSVTSFRCPRKPISTVDIEACAGQRLLRIDREFNEQAATLWSVLDAPGRRAFINAHRSWLIHRRQWCEVGPRKYLGGTAAGVIAGQCQVDVTAAWLKDVRSMVDFYCEGMVKTGRFRRCPHS